MTSDDGFVRALFLNTNFLGEKIHFQKQLFPSLFRGGILVLSPADPQSTKIFEL